RKMFAVMTLLCLTRDTGTVVVAAFVAFFMIRGEWRRALAGLAAMVPFGLWVLYVTALHPLQIRTWTPEQPYAWPWPFLTHGASYSFPPAINLIVRVMDL